MKPIIELKNVSLVRSEQLILDRINWTVGAGSCAAILGHNGSGKSTIARIVACHLWPTAGKVAVLGQEFGEANLPELRHQIRLVQPAGPYDIDPSLTALQVALTGFFGTLNLYDAVEPAMIDAADDQLRRFGLAHLAEHSYATLSSGEKVRSLLARAMVSRPKLLLLDEPTAGLDVLAREQVLATIQSLAGELSIVIITHHVEELPPATSNVLLLRQGKVVAAGLPAEVLTGSMLTEAYNCPVQVRRSNGRYYVEVSPDSWTSLL
jgi:iron complex transport system ATP-binding protein